MQLDTNIALNAKPAQILTPNELMTNAYTMQNAQQANQLNRMKLDEYSRGLAEDTQIKNALTKLNPTSPTYEQDRYNAYALKGVEGLKTLAAIKKEEAQTGLTGVETSGKKLSNIDAIRKHSATTFKDIYSRPSDANITALFEDSEESKLYPPEALAGMKQRMQQILSVPAPIDPATGKPDYSLRQQAIMQMNLEAKDMLGKTGKSDIGGSIQNEITDPITGKVTVTGTTAKTATPGELITKDTTERGQNMTAATAKAAQNATNARELQRINNEQNPNVVAHQQVSEDGTVTNFNKFGQVIGTVKGVGKPSAQFTKTKEQTKKLNSDLNLTITELENATKDGGLIDQSTGSGLGKATNAIRGFVTGGASEGAIAGAKLAPIADLALKMVPRFEGPQSDKDTQSYKEAAGQLADTSIPNEIRKEAGKTVLRLMKARKNQFTSQDLLQGGASPTGDGVDSSNPLLK